MLNRSAGCPFQRPWSVSFCLPRFSGSGNKLGGASSASKRKPLVKKVVVKKKAAPASKPKAAVVDDGKWACARCTFLNEKEHLACDVCAGERCQTDFTE